MKKLLFVLNIIAMTFVQFANAQSSAYPFVSSSGTYTEITGGTLLIDGTSSMDSWVSTAITIPSFTFNGVAYTTAYVTSNGLLTLGGSAPSAYSYTGISSGSGSGICICPFNADLDRVNTNATTEMRWEIIGNEIVLQWKQMKRYAQTENFDFQVRLNTLSGLVSFVYQLNSGPGSGTSYQPEVGIRTSATDFNNRTVASGTENWDTSLPGTLNDDVCRFTSATPQKNFTSGLTYTWTPATCFPPTALAASNITTTSADLSWIAPVSGTPNGYEWKVVLFGAGPGGTAVATNTTTHPTVTDNASGLSASTAYHLYVRTDCGSGDFSVWAGPYSFVTVCGPVSIPYNEGFESITANNQLPACMAATSLGTKNLTYTASGTYNRIPHSGSKFASFQYAPAGNWFFFVPIQLISGISYDASVWYITDGDPGFDALNIAYGTSQDSAAMTIIGSAVAPTNTTYQQLIATFVPAVSGVYYIGIQANGTSYDPWYLTIDDIFVEETPSCVAPTALTADSITTTSAQLGWATSLTVTLWNIELGLSGFIPTGTPTSIGVTNPYPVSSLTANTSYSYYVQADCGLGDLSTWTGPYSFVTLCNPASIPYTQDFESVTVPAIPICTSIENAGTGNNWITSNAPGYGFTSKTLEYPYNSTNSANAWFYTSALNLTSGVSYRLTFRYGNNSTSYIEKLKVAYGTAAINTSMTSVLLDFPSINQAVSQYAVVDFTTLVSGVYYIGFNAYSASNQYNLYVDDILVEVTPTCPGIIPGSLTASNPTVNSIDLTWVEPGTATQWQIEYGLSGFTQGTGTLVIANTNPFTLIGLNSATNYQAYIRSICSSGDTSSWKVPVAFTTLCLLNNLPYFEGFESITVNDELPACMLATSLGYKTLTYISSDTYNRIPKSGTNFASFHNAPEGNWFFFAPVQLFAGVTYVASVWYITDGATGFEDLNMAYGNAQNAAAMTQYIAIVANPTNTTYQQLITTFIPSVTGVYYIGIQADGTSYNPWYLTIDDISIQVLFADDASITAINAPNTPVSVGSSTVTTTIKNFGGATLATATIAWSVNGVTQTPYTWNGSLATSATAGPVSIGNYNFATAGLYTIKVWTENPNGNTDGNHTNDTTTKVVYVQSSYAALPFIENFDGTWINKLNTNDVPSIHWINTPAVGNQSWRRNDEGTTANWSNPSFYSYTLTGSIGTLNSARFHSSYAPNKSTGIMDAFLNFTGTGNKTLKFWYINTSGSDSLKVLLSTDGGNTFTFQGQYTTASTWQLKQLSLGTSTSSTVVLRFMAISDYGTSDIGIDGVQVSILQPNDVGVVSVINPLSKLCGLVYDSVNVIVWNNGTSSQSNIPVVLDVTTPSGNIVLNNTLAGPLVSNAIDTLFVGILNTVTPGNYTFKAFTNLSGDITYFNDTINTSITINVPTYPYVEDFELSTSLTNWTTNMSRGNGHGNSSYVLYKNLWSSSTLLATATTNNKIGPLTSNSALTFDYRYTDYYLGTAFSLGLDSLIVQISDDCGATFTTVHIINVTNHVTSANMKNVSVPLSAYAGDDILINFIAKRGATGDYYIDLDNINVADSTLVVVNEYSNNPDINIFPNPTNDMINVVINGINSANLTIYTLQGQTVYAEKLNAAITNKQLDLSYLPKGIYMVRISNEKNNILRKLIIQ